MSNEERPICPVHDQREPCMHNDHNEERALARQEKRKALAPKVEHFANEFTHAYLAVENPEIRGAIMKLLETGGADLTYLPIPGDEDRAIYAKINEDKRRRQRAIEELRFRDETYADYAAEKAGDVRALFREHLYTAEELDEIPPTEWLAPSLLAKNSLAWLYGDPGCYKSFAALDIAASIALGVGIEWAGAPTLAAPVLYIAAEGSGGMRKRVRAWEARSGKSLAGRLTFLTTSIRITEESFLNVLLEVCREIRPGLVIIDTQSRVTPGLDENGSVMSTYVDAVSRVREETGACVFTVHHTTKGGDVLRGHGSLYGAADTVLYMSRTAGTDRHAKVQIKKQKDDRDDLFWNVRMIEQHSCGRRAGEDHDGRDCGSLVIASAKWSEVISAQATTYEKVRLVILDLEPQQSITKAQIMDVTGLPDSSVKGALKTLCEQGQLQKTGMGKDTAYLRPDLTLDDASASSASFSQPA